MAYDQFQNDKPVASDTGLEFADTTRENLMALRDAVQMGAVVGWDFSADNGSPETPETPAAILYTHNVTAHVIRGTLTWGTTGGADGNVTIALWEYNDGGGYETIGTETIAYDTAGNVTTTTWS